MRNPVYLLAAEARLDLAEIWNYLAEEASLAIADKIIADIEVGIGQIVQSPGIGHRRDDLTKDRVLFYRVHSYFVIYQPKRSPLYIVRVVHAARDIEQLL